MKILLLGDVGHVNLVSWARSLMRHGSVELHLASPNRACEAVPGATFHQLPLGPIVRRARYVIGVRALRKLIADLRPDLLIAYRTTSYGFMAASSGFHPFVAIAQGSDIFPARCGWLVRLLNRLVIGKADLTQVWEAHMAERVRTFAPALTEVLTVPKGIELGHFPYQEGRVTHGDALVCTRQLRASYRHDVILRALAKLREQGHVVKMLFVGDGECRAELEELAGRLQLGATVEFAGKVQHDAMAEKLRSRDVYVSMQPSDGVSASLLEAMACGLFPVVAENAANRAWIRDGETGFLVPSGDHLLLAERIGAALANAPLRERASRANRRLVEDRACTHRNTSLIIARYHELVASRSRGTS